MTKIIGLNSYHPDSSACLLVDGKLMSFIEEERLTRIKHWAGFPKYSIEYCLNSENLKIEDIDYFTINSNPRNFISKKILFTILNPNLNFLSERIRSYFDKSQKREINKKLFYAQKIDHHVSHIASSVYFSNFDDSSFISIDGFGDFTSCCWGIFSKQKINILGRVFFPHSLGIFYHGLTQFMGFYNYGDEYKVMGLSAYGRNEFQNQLKNLINFDESYIYKLNLDYFDFYKKGIYRNKNGESIYKDLFNHKLSSLLNIEKNKDTKDIHEKYINLSNSAQFIFEDIYFKLIRFVQKKTNLKRLVLSGGCSMNSLANGKIQENSDFEEVYIPPWPGDAGGAIGSAIYKYHELNNFSKKNINRIVSPYLGPSYSDEEIKKILTNYAHQINFNYYNDDILIDKVTASLTEQKIIGWFQGKMECGARALGNRSIIADPRSNLIKDLINSKIKLREMFRPFAPSILREHVSDWFENDIDVPYMSKVFKIKNEKKELVPAITHRDGTGRLQTVKRDDNIKYYNLINSFYKKTNVPLLLNTSLNENEPIVCNPNEAINLFLRTDMDLIVIENFYITKK